MPELSVVGVRAGSWQEPAMVLLKEERGDRYLPLTASASTPRHRPAAGISVGLVRDLLTAVGAPPSHVEVAEAHPGGERLVLVVGDGVRVPATLVEAVTLAVELGLTIHCPDPVLAAEGVAADVADRLYRGRTLSDPAPTSAYRVVDLDATTQMEAIQAGGLAGAEAPAGGVVLQIRQGPGAGAVFVLDGEVVSCGRDGSNGIVLDGATVSRKHADFHRHGAGYTVTDLDSLNGTYVNGERVQTAALVAGDEIRIGRYRLIFEAR